MPAQTRAQLLDPAGTGYQTNRLMAMLVRGEYPDGTPIVGTVDGLEGAWRDDFPGTGAINAANWNVLHSQGGVAPSGGTASLLTLGTGTPSGDETEIVSTYIFQAPFRVQFGVNAISQRIANQEFSFEFVEVDTTTGLPKPGADAGNNRAGIFLTGTNPVAGAEIRSVNGGDLINLTGQSYAVSTASPHMWEIDFQGDDIYFYQSNVDSINARTNSWHLNRRLPDPTAWYAVRVRAKNTAVAASNTNLVLDHVYVENSTFIPVEIARSRGASSLLETLPVTATLNPSGSMAGYVGLQARNSGGASVYRNIATNAGAVVKAGVTNIYGLIFSNTGASMNFVKLYNKATAPVLGTDVPVMTIPVPAGQTVTINSDMAASLNLGLGVAASNLLADADTTAPSGPVVVNIFYA